MAGRFHHGSISGWIGSFEGMIIGIMTRFNFASRRPGALLVLLLCAFPLYAKDAPLQTIEWPSTGTPVIRFTFGKLKSLPGMGGLHGYVMDTTAENLSARRIP